MNEDQATTPRKGIRWEWALRGLTALVGLVLVVAGVAKATDLELFIKQIGDYRILSGRVGLAITAWGLIVIECALGVALIVYYRPKANLLAAGLLFLLFLGAIVWAWATGATESCGCFGAWAKRTPAEAVFEDMVLLAGVGLAWLGHRRRPAIPSRGKGWAVAVACLVGLALPLVFGFPISAISRPQSNPQGITLGNLRVEGLDQIDLTRGEYIIMLFDTECSHCQEAVPNYNGLVSASGLPPVVGLCKNEEWRRMVFAEAYKPSFPLGQISEPDFMRLLMTGDTPRTLLVRDMRVVHIWDEQAPTQAEVKAALKR